MNDSHNPAPRPTPSAAPNAPPAAANDALTFMVFKDGLSARTFQISAGWISRLGLLLGAFAFITAGAIFLTARTYLALHHAKRDGDPARVHELETELAQEKSAHQTDLAKVAFLGKTPVGDSSHAPESTPPPVTAVVTPPVSLAVRQAPPASSVLFAGLPAGAASNMADRSTLPFKLIQTKAYWRGGILRVNFAIQYTRDDGGNQQGHIVILARGPETLLAYPDGALNSMTADTLIKPEAGEYFSVSRFREVTAEFGPVPTRDQIQEVQILLLDTNKKLLVQERVIPEKPAARKRSDKPAPETDKDDADVPAAPSTSEEKSAAPAPQAAPPESTASGTESGTGE